MNIQSFQRLLAVAAVLAPWAAGAQSAPPRPDPQDPAAATAPTVYRSALGSYRRPSAEPPAVAWREANDAVLRIGGWRAYAREANAAQATASAPAPAATPASAPGSTRPAAPSPAHRHGGPR